MNDLPATLPWHHEARRLWEGGLRNHVEIGRRVGRDGATVQAFLNPYSAAKRKAYNARWRREQRAARPDFARRENEAKRRYGARKRRERLASDPQFAERVLRRAAAKRYRAAVLDRRGDPG